jgi:hypothetical protein
MSNSIDKNLEINNSISNLSFLWIARFKDESKIYQIDKRGVEHRFKEVLDRWEELSYFYLTNNRDKTFTIDLNNGLIFFNNHQSTEEDLKKEKKNIRLIYFRRNIIEFNINNLKENNKKIIYFLGLQYLDNNDINRKIILQIDKQGNFLIGE